MNDQTTASAIRRDVALFPELHVSIVSYLGNLWSNAHSIQMILQMTWRNAAFNADQHPDR